MDVPELEEIRQEWAVKLKLLPEEITLEVIKKPGLFSHQWEVRLIWQGSKEQASLLNPSQVRWDETKYVLILGEGVKRFAPFVQAGEVWFNGKRQDKPFRIETGDQLEFYPMTKTGKLTWELQVRLHGLSAVAKVSHEQAGHYVLSKNLPVLEEIDRAMRKFGMRRS
ncbi:conserved hypothetical protein [Candidatus Desulfosporosinus infrequens]|uniref:Uncharacterized protein n=1 Tax=Candidatus Desulfosporosinus infrequens TaxID=2043169 RepID=A0A2U3LF09_9FIRM|nr:conserved hypothetical protein [Candidatus Desulfosporosinus infrequens]